jgi:hypothetical protein
MSASVRSVLEKAHRHHVVAVALRRISAIAVAVCALVLVDASSAALGGPRLPLPVLLAIAATVLGLIALDARRNRDLSATAQLLDRRAGLDDLLVTAWELEQRGSTEATAPWSSFVKARAERAAPQLDVARLLPLRSSSLLGWATGMLGLALALHQLPASAPSRQLLAGASRETTSPATTERLARMLPERDARRGDLLDERALALVPEDDLEEDDEQGTAAGSTTPPSSDRPAPGASGDRPEATGGNRELDQDVERAASARDPEPGESGGEAEGANDESRPTFREISRDRAGDATREPAVDSSEREGETNAGERSSPGEAARSGEVRSESRTVQRRELSDEVVALDLPGQSGSERKTPSSSADAAASTGAAAQRASPSDNAPVEHSGQPQAPAGQATGPQLGESEPLGEATTLEVTLQTAMLESKSRAQDETERQWRPSQRQDVTAASARHLVTTPAQRLAERPVLVTTVPARWRQVVRAYFDATEVDAPEPDSDLGTNPPRRQP